jgi:hypothetical protein
MYAYYAYELGISSEIVIPEFISAQVKPDVTITVDNQAKVTQYVPQEALNTFWCFKVHNSKAFFYHRDAGVFLIEDGSKVIFVPVDNPSEELIRIALIETVMAMLLYQRGRLVLHGSGVNINGNGVVFVGKSGQGKSSTAGAFHRHGYEIITDDVAPINLSQKEPTIAPGFPQLKLGEEIAAELGHDFATLPILYPSESKRCYRPQQDFSLAPLALKRIYMLTDAPEFSIEALNPSEAVFELSRNSRPTSVSHARDREHFARCANFARNFTVYRLKRPRNLALLPQLVQIVEDHLATESKVLVPN